ncbi:hypothetical protein, partial [Actinocorallia lasiicapitis]
ATADLTDATAGRFRLLADARPDGALPADAARRITLMKHAVELRADFTRAKGRRRYETYTDLLKEYRDASPILDYLVPLLPRLMRDLEPEFLLTALIGAQPGLRRRYLDDTAELLLRPGDLAYRTAAGVYEVATAADVQGYRELADQLALRLRTVLAGWSQREVRQIGKRLKKADEQTAAEFELWVEQNFHRRTLTLPKLRWKSRD